MNATEKKKKIGVSISFIIFFLFFLSFLNIKLWDYDFWWHIATGRYIIEKHEIPSQDPFSYVTEENREQFKDTSLREKFLMRQYWLAQVLFYYAYTLSGSWGIVIIRSLLLTLTLWLVYKGLRRFKVPGLFSISLLIPVFYVLIHKYTGERPVLFSFALTVLVFLIIDGFIRAKGKGLYFLPFVMLLWGNLHGGFILGVVIIVVYLAIEVLRFILKQSEFSKEKFYIFSSLMVLSLISSFMNPNGLTILSMFQSKYKIFTAGVQEYQPLLEFYFRGVFTIDYSLFFIVAIIIITLIFRFMKMQLSHLVLLSSFLIMSFLHQRYFVFTATVGIIIVGKEIAELYRNWLLKYQTFNYRFIEKITVFLMVLFILFFTGRTTLTLANNIKNLSGDYDVSREKGAIEFIEKNKMPGLMFNTDLIGGYAIWRLYPWKQVFTDTRAIDIASIVEHNTIIEANSLESGGKPIWERLLNIYDINFVVINPLDFYGGLKPLVKAINENKRWVLVYTDGSYLIFIRNSEENKNIIKQYSLKKEDAYWSIIASTSFMALNNPNNPFFFNTIGECFMNLKNYDEAEKAFKHVLRIEPNNAEANNALTEILNIKQSENKEG